MISSVGVLEQVEASECVAEPGIKRPPLRAVIMLNDDYTPMEFVMDILESVFGMDEARAKRIMLQVHYLGEAICGYYLADIAETKAARVVELAQLNGYPLLCLTRRIEE